MQNPQGFLQKEVSRKEFLQYLGIAFLSLIGVMNMLQNVQQTTTMSTQRKPHLPLDYGAGAYGP